MYGWNNTLVTTHNTPGCNVTVIWPGQPRPPFVPAAPPPPVHYPPHQHAPYHCPPHHYPHGPPPRPHYPMPMPVPVPAPPAPVRVPVPVPTPTPALAHQLPAYTEKKTSSTMGRKTKNPFLDDVKRHSDIPGASSLTLTRHGRAYSAQSEFPSRPFGESSDTMPQLFLIAPPLENPCIEGANKPFRILIPCQAPSLLHGDRDSIHLTHHEGFKIQNPRDLVNKCKGLLRYLDAISMYLFMGAAAAATAHGFPIHPGDILHDSLSRLHQMAHNRDYLNRAGIEESRFYSKQSVVDNHQIDAMKALFRSAGLMNSEFGVRPIHFGGPTKWVCEECYQVLSDSRDIVADHLMSLREYIELTRRSMEANVVLRCSASVITFTKTVQKSPRLRKVTLHIKSGYFQTSDRQAGTQYNAIKFQFDDLGKVLHGRSLQSVNIQGDRGSGSVFAGLQQVFKCPDLKSLHIKGMPHFLRDVDLRNCTRKLEELKLDGVHIDSQDTATQLAKLLQENSALKVLSLSRTRLTAAALSVLVSRHVEKRFAKLTQLNLSDNDFDAATARTLVAMALKGDRLSRLDLSNCSGIGAAGCRQILELLRFRGRRLDSVVMDGTGITYDISAEMDRFRNSRE
ncbi:MAG: hypothetical protein J3Q66DRAFT_422503 [Benniella sp.]|nr:MAG: hypothetical protein J3Q66DRAFT_422503 [Benniella sp.]